MVDSGLPLPVVIAGVILGALGTAGIGGVVTTALRDRAERKRGERSVAVEEIDRAIPGLGEMLEQYRIRMREQEVEIRQLRAAVRRARRSARQPQGTPDDDDDDD